MQTRINNGREEVRTARGIWVLRWCGNCYFAQCTERRDLGNNLCHYCFARRKEINNRHCKCTTWDLNDKDKKLFGPVYEDEQNEFFKRQNTYLHDNI